MADEIVVRYDGDVKKLEDKLKSIEKEQLAIDKAAKKSGQSIADGAEKSAKAVGKVEKQTHSLKNAFSDLSQHLPFAGAIQQVNALSGSMINAGKSVTGVSGTFKVLKAAIASTGIGALVIALGSLVAYFTKTEEGGDRLAKIMRVVGAVFDEFVKTLAKAGEFLVDIGDSIGDYIGVTENAVKATNDYTKSTIQLAQELADLEDQIEALTIDIERQNDKLQTAIESNLKKLRNQNLTLSESRDLIFDIGAKDTQRLQNSNKLIDANIEKERKSFILKTQNLEDLSAVERQGIILLQNDEIDAIEKGDQARLKSVRERLKQFDEILTRNREHVKLYDQFVNDEIDADTLLDKAKGTFGQADAERIAALKKQREASIRESQLINDRLDNLETAAEEKDKARQERIRQDIEKTFQAKLKQIALEEKLAIGVAKINEASDRELVVIEQQFNQERIKLFEDSNRTREGEYQELLLNQRKLEKDYSGFLKQEEDARLKALKDADDRKLKEQKEFDDQMRAEDDEASEKLQEMWKKQTDEFIANEHKKAEEAKQIRQQLLQDSIHLFTQAANAINDLQLARATSEIETERQAQQKITEDRLVAIDARAKAGVLSETQANAQKQKIQRDAAKKESELKKRQFEAEQKASINRINISTAEAIVKTLATYGFTPLAAIAIAGVIASGELQKAAVRSQPVPKFKDGVIDLKGKGTGTSDSIPAMLSKGETVMTAKETRQYKPLFESIREGYFDKYANENFVKPALKREAERNRIKEEREKAAYEYMKSMTLNGLVDTSHLERLTKKNKSVRLENSKEIIDGIGNILNSKKNRGL
jgi:hypothetical protein